MKQPGETRRATPYISPTRQTTINHLMWHVSQTGVRNVRSFKPGNGVNNWVIMPRSENWKDSRFETKRMCLLLLPLSELF